jgi:hypothetical protein
MSSFTFGFLVLGMILLIGYMAYIMWLFVIKAVVVLAVLGLVAFVVTKGCSN